MKALRLLASLGIIVLPAVAAAVDLLLPSGVSLDNLSGKYVNVTGSDTKFLEDHNVQDGVEGELSAYKELSDNRSLQVDAVGQSGEEQGWFIGGYRRLSHYSLLVDTTASQRFYNARTGFAPITASGLPLTGLFPFSNDGRTIFGNDDPSIHRISSGFNVDYQPKHVFDDVYLDFHYRTINGQETMIKGGTVNDLSRIANPGGSGPGTVAFDFPGRKVVDYEMFRPILGGRSGLGGLNWQTDASYENSSLKSDVIEANLGNSRANTEFDRYRERSDVHNIKYDLVSSRFLRPSLYVYGGYLFSYDKNNPAPQEDIASGRRLPFIARSVNTSDVHRLGNGMTVGMMFHPHSTVVVTADAGARGYIQKGEIVENRNENFGTVRAESNRDWVVANGRLVADWMPLPRALVRTAVRYQDTRAVTESSRLLNLVQQQRAENQDYTDRFRTIEGGPSLRWTAGYGRAVEAGYTFLYEDVDVNVDQIRNDYIQNDYIRRRHRPYMKGTAQILKNLRSELRFEYVVDRRNLRAPIVNPVIFNRVRGGVTKWEGYSVVPSLWYQPDPHWSLNSTVSVGQQRLNVDNLAALPATFRDFQYDALTETVSAGVGYNPSDVWSVSAAYSYVHDGHRSVNNQLHGGEVMGRFKLNDRWGVHGGYRYYRYDQDTFSVDDYRASAVFLGVSGRF